MDIPADLISVTEAERRYALQRHIVHCAANAGRIYSQMIRGRRYYSLRDIQRYAHQWEQYRQSTSGLVLLSTACGRHRITRHYALGESRSGRLTLITRADPDGKERLYVRSSVFDAEIMAISDRQQAPVVSTTDRTNWAYPYTADDLAIIHRVIRKHEAWRAANPDILLSNEDTPDNLDTPTPYDH